METSYCGFEHMDLCGFTNVYYDDMDWIWWTGPSQLTKTGAPFDHTCRNHYGKSAINKPCIIPSIFEVAL